MVKFCVMRACKNRDVTKTKGIGVTHHEFPTSEESRVQWETFVNKYNRTSGWRAGRGSKSAFLCTEHFEKDFYTASGRRLSKSAVPTIAPKFTAEVAHKYGLIPNLHSHLLDSINNFEQSYEEALSLGNEEAEHCKSLESCEMSEDLVEMSMHIETSEVGDSSLPCPTAAEIIRMPAVIDMPTVPVQPRSPSVTEVTDVLDPLSPKNNLESDETQPLLRQPSSFDSVLVNPPCESEVRPVKRGRKRFAGDLKESDFISPQSRKQSVSIFKDTIQNVKRRVKALHQKVRRARKKIIDLKSLLNHLEEEKLIVPDVSNIIKVELEVLFSGLSVRSDVIN